MTTIERPEKRVVVVRCGHPWTEGCEDCRAALAQQLARWSGELPAGRQQRLDEQRACRERVALAGRPRPAGARLVRQPPLAIDDDDERYGDSPLGALGAWTCVALAVLLMVTLAIRQLWLWW